MDIYIPKICEILKNPFYLCLTQPSGYFSIGNFLFLSLEHSLGNAAVAATDQPQMCHAVTCYQSGLDSKESLIKGLFAKVWA